MAEKGIYKVLNYFPHLLCILTHMLQICSIMFLFNKIANSSAEKKGVCYLLDEAAAGVVNLPPFADKGGGLN